jgi:hypothetical protein
MNLRRGIAGGIVEWLRAISPSCRDVAHLQAASMNKTLPLTRRLGVAAHIYICKWCRRYTRQLESLRTLTRGPRRSDTLPAPLSNESRERLKTALAACKDEGHGPTHSRGTDSKFTR